MHNLHERQLKSGLLLSVFRRLKWAVSITIALVDFGRGLVVIGQEEEGRRRRRRRLGQYLGLSGPISGVLGYYESFFSPHMLRI
jgi:hypothetical protein